MNPSALRFALRLRQAAVVAAQRHLAECIGVEMQAADAARHANAAIQHEADAASAITADDATVAAFAAWLPNGRSAQAVAAARHAACLDATGVARAGLGVARAGEARVIEALEVYAAQLRVGVLEAERAALNKAEGAARNGWRNFLRW